MLLERRGRRSFLARPTLYLEDIFVMPSCRRQGMGSAPNHRFVTSLVERQATLDRGFVAEGNGIGVGMCAPG